MALKVQGQRLDPSSDSPDARALPRRSAPSRAPFVFGHLPKRWDWDDEAGRFLPQISTITFSPGVQGTRALRDAADGRPQMDTSACRAHFERKGGVIIDPSDHRLGDYRGYQQRVRNDGGAEVNFSIFESYDVIGTDVWWEHNEGEFRAFRMLLLRAKIVPDIHRRVRESLIEAQEKTIANLQKRFGAAPSHEGLRSELDFAMGKLRAMREQIPTADALALIRAEQREAAEVEADQAEQRATARRKPVKAAKEDRA